MKCSVEGETNGAIDGTMIPDKKRNIKIQCRRLGCTLTLQKGEAKVNAKNGPDPEENWITTGCSREGKIQNNRIRDG